VSKDEKVVKSRNSKESVIPAKAGIQLSPLTLPLSPANGGEGGGEGEGSISFLEEGSSRFVIGI